MTINPRLAEKRGISKETLAKIEHLHSYRNHLDKDRLEGKLSRDEYLKLWAANEYDLQELWGFPRDASMHAFWNSEYCTCPKMDNRERVGTGYFIYNKDCPLHGWKEEE